MMLQFAGNRQIKNDTIQTRAAEFTLCLLHCEINFSAARVTNLIDFAELLKVWQPSTCTGGLFTLVSTVLAAGIAAAPQCVHSYNSQNPHAPNSSVSIFTLLDGTFSPAELIIIKFHCLHNIFFLGALLRCYFLFFSNIN